MCVLVCIFWIEIKFETFMNQFGCRTECSQCDDFFWVFVGIVVYFGLELKEQRHCVALVRQYLYKKNIVMKIRWKVLGRSRALRMNQKKKKCSTKRTTGKNHRRVTWVAWARALRWTTISKVAINKYANNVWTKYVGPTVLKNRQYSVRFNVKCVQCDYRKLSIEHCGLTITNEYDNNMWLKATSIQLRYGTSAFYNW